MFHVQVHLTTRLSFFVYLYLNSKLFTKTSFVEKRKLQVSFKVLTKTGVTNHLKYHELINCNQF